MRGAWRKGTEEPQQEEIWKQRGGKSERERKMKKSHTGAVAERVTAVHIRLGWVLLRTLRNTNTVLPITPERRGSWQAPHGKTCSLPVGSLQRLASLWFPAGLGPPRLWRRLGEKS